MEPYRGWTLTDSLESAVGSSRRGRRRSYDFELEQLELSYENVLSFDATHLRRSLLQIAGGPALFVGSGGTLPVARMAARLHESVAGQLAKVVTPLDLARLPSSMRAPVVIFSAGARHPDVREAFRRCANGRFSPTVLVTLRSEEELLSLTNEGIVVASLPPLSFKEGFLATNSVLTMMAVLVKSYSGDEALPQVMPRGEFLNPPPLDNLLVLTAPELEPAAHDIETRLSELGAASVQVTDYRNFAHGRHFGLSRRVENTSVLALTFPQSNALAGATLAELRKAGFDPSVWESASSSPIAALELTVASMHLTASLSREKGLAPSKPGVQSFGRRLYHLPTKRLIPDVIDGPIERKLAALGAGNIAGTVRELYQVALSQWQSDLKKVRFGAILMDYDGTICQTAGRFGLPRESIKKTLISLLASGVPLGFASGRGRSLHFDLRSLVPEALWDSVLLGLYNGSCQYRLSDDIPDLRHQSEWTGMVMERLEGLSLVSALRITPRVSQVTVELGAEGFARIANLRESIADAFAQEPQIPTKIVTSAHSMDIVAPETSKVALLKRMQALWGEVLVVGDQGAFGGNDFEVLAASRWTLSVDQCSADPTRCWYLGRGDAGPKLTERYLRACIAKDRRVRFAWKQIEV